MRERTNYRGVQGNFLKVIAYIPIMMMATRLYMSNCTTNRDEFYSTDIILK